MSAAASAGGAIRSRPPLTAGSLSPTVGLTFTRSSSSSRRKIAFTGMIVAWTVAAASPSPIHRSTSSCRSGRRMSAIGSSPRSSKMRRRRFCSYPRTADGLYGSPDRVRTLPLRAAASHAVATSRRLSVWPAFTFRPRRRAIAASRLQEAASARSEKVRRICCCLPPSHTSAR